MIIFLHQSNRIKKRTKKKKVGHHIPHMTKNVTLDGPRKK